MIDTNKLIAQGQALETLDKLYQLVNLLNAGAVKNLLLVGQSEQSRVEVFINPNLYRLAVIYYGSVEYWTVIANANNLSDPKINGTITLLIPPKPAVDPESILNPTFSTSAS